MDVPDGLPQVVAELEPGGRIVEIRALAGGVSATVHAVEIHTASGAARHVVFRQHPGVDFKAHDSTVTAKEYHLLSELHRLGLRVPQPYLLSEPELVAPFLAMEWIDGSTKLADRHVAGAMRQMAEFLVGLHSLDPSSLHVPELEPIEGPRLALDRYLPQTDLGEAVRAQLAAEQPDMPSGRQVVLHGDYWPGNVLWRSERLLAVIDWEDATLGDPMADLATARLELLCQHGSDAMVLFTDSYVDRYRASVGPLHLDSLVIWELYASASALSMMGAWGLEPSDEARRRQHTQQFFDDAARQLTSDTSR